MAAQIKTCDLPGCELPVPTHWPNGVKKSEARFKKSKYCGLSHAKIHTHMMGEKRGNKRVIKPIRAEDIDNVINMKSYEGWFMRSYTEKFLFRRLSCP